jgi:hypothetical protein
VTPIDISDLTSEELDALARGLDQILDPDSGEVIVA